MYKWKVTNLVGILLTLLVLPAAEGICGDEARAEWTIVATYPIPENASGLAYDGSWLYCGIYGVNGGRIFHAAVILLPVLGAMLLWGLFCLINSGQW